MVKYVHKCLYFNHMQLRVQAKAVSTMFQWPCLLQLCLFFKTLINTFWNEKTSTQLIVHVILWVFLLSMDILEHTVCWRREILTTLTSCVATFSIRMCHLLHCSWSDSYRHCYLCPQHCDRLVPTRYITQKPWTDPQSVSVRNITPPNTPLHI